MIMTEQKITQIDKRSWFQRMGSSLKGIFTGLVLFIIAFPLLIWNEGRDIQIDRSLREGASLVTSIDATVADSQRDGKLIHFTSEARTPSILTDEAFAISENALKLKRTVEIYQWTEEQQTTTVEKIGGSSETSSTYSYKQIWSDSLIDSSTFQDKVNYPNPQTKILENFEQVASPVSVGVFTLPDRLVSSLADYERLNLPSDLLISLPYAQQEQWQIFNNYIYQSADPTNSQIGDARIWYQIIKPGLVSVIAQQNGENLQAYQTKNGKSIEMIRIGEVSAEEMFAGALQANRLTSWIIRFLAFMFMFLGLNTLLAPLTILVSVIPFFAKILRSGTKLLSGVIALLLSLVTIGITWLIYRPLIGVMVLFLAVLVIIIFSRIKNKNQLKNKI